MVLRRDHFIAVADQQLDDLAETGSVGPQTMCKDNAGFAGHAEPPRTVTCLSDARMFGRRVRKGPANFLLEGLASLSSCGFFFQSCPLLILVHRRADGINDDSSTS